MPKIDIANVPVKTTSVYPAPFAHVAEGRSKQALGNEAGLTQFGVNLTRLAPGSQSAIHHWHENEDEFVFILDGEITLVEGDEETVLTTGEAAGFKAGVPTGHHLINRSDDDAVYLEIGARAMAERAHYPGQDLVFERINQDFKFRRTDGSHY